MAETEKYAIEITDDTEYNAAMVVTLTEYWIDQQRENHTGEGEWSDFVLVVDGSSRAFSYEELKALVEVGQRKGA